MNTTTMSLDGRTTQELDALRARQRNGGVPAAALATLDAEKMRLMLSGLAEQALKEGDLAPNFILPDVDGKAVGLYDLLNEKPVVVTFYRGLWCPFCNVTLAGLQRSLPRMINAQLVAISPQLPDRSLTTVEKYGLTFPVLSDVGSTVARSFGVAFKLSDELRWLYRTFGHGLEEFNGHETGDTLPIPATFLIGQDKRVRWRFVDVDYTRRADPDVILDVIDRLSH